MWFVFKLSGNCFYETLFDLKTLDAHYADR